MDEGALDAVSVARLLEIDPERVFKTLVARDDGGRHLAFCIPGAAELDLKKAAVAAGSKRVAMVPRKDLLPLTGYVHGGCSPVGMKRALPTFIDETVVLHDRILVSAGVRGLQIEIAPADLQRATDATVADLTA